MIQQTPTIPPTDAELLMQFNGTRDDDAFRLLVERHAGLVWTVCRRVLKQQQDVEDAFQATFLVLARQAGSIRSSDSMASWLFKVAHRTAVRAARDSKKLPERPLAEDVAIPSEELAQLQRRETFELLAAELNRLPENYRAPLILFYLEGKSRQATADELDVSDAALKARLARGRKLLRRRLMRRGVALSLAMTAVTLASQTGQPAISTSLLNQTVAAGLSYAATGTASAACSAQIVSLAKGVQPMLTTSLTKSTLSVGTVLTAGLLLAVTVGSHASFAGSPANDQSSIDTTVESSGPAKRAETTTGVSPKLEIFSKLVEAKRRKSPGSKQKPVIEALSETTEVEFVDTSLMDAMDFIADLHRISIIVDTIDLQKKGIKSDVPITYTVSGVSVQNALDGILKPLGLAYVVEDGLLKVTAATAKANETSGPLDLSERSEAEEKIEAALTKTTQIEFVDTALKDAMDFISELHKIPIILDENALNSEGIATDEPITQVLSDIPLQSVLNIVFKPLKLAYVIEDDVMTITTQTAAAEQKETRVYSVKPLVDAGFEIDALQDIIESQAGGEAKSLGKTGVLVVTAPQQTHRKILKLLEQLQRAAELQNR